VAKLHIIYDPDTRSFVGASVGGKFLYGVASVVLSREGISVLDYEGRDLLAGPKADESVPDHSRAAADIAAAFGATLGVVPPLTTDLPAERAEPARLDHLQEAIRRQLGTQTTDEGEVLSFDDLARLRP
jgi:hypothetical protein